MTNQRADIQLGADDQRTMLETARTLQVASLNPDGWPHLVPMWFAVNDGGLIAFTTYYSSQKVRNLERDPRITVLVETGDVYNELRGLSIDGEAEIVRDPQVTFRIRALISAKHEGKPRPPMTTVPVEDLPNWAFKRVTILVHPRRARSWDHSKVR